MQQRSPEWFAARLGKWTASSFAALMAAPGTDAFLGLVKDKAWERMTGQPVEFYTTAAMQHGIDCEDEARTWYEFETLREVSQVGFLVHPDIPTLGCSPDGLVDDGLLEIKCPQPRAHLDTLATRKLPSKYRWQVQGQMFIAARSWLDFVSYHPATGGIVIRVEANKEDAASLAARVEVAEAKVAELISQAEAA